MSVEHRALQPGRIGPLSLRNRVVKTATFEGMTPEGVVTERLIAHHRGMAEGGVALTTVAYGAVEAQGRTFSQQLLVGPQSAPGLARLARAVHDAGGAVSLQLAHCGGFTKTGRPSGPSAGWNAYGTASGHPRIHAMAEPDLARVEAAFAQAAQIALDAGFDAVEVHVGHGYLLSQFLSPLLNRRRDAYGGDLPGRLRFPLRVVRAVVEQVGSRVAVLAKMNLADGLPGGLTEAEAPAIAQALESAGVHALVTSGGLVQRSAFYLLRGDVPLSAMAKEEPGWLQSLALRGLGRFLVRPFAWSPGFFLDAGQSVVRAVDVPVVALGGLDSAATLERALRAGYGFVAMGRTLLADPDFVQRLAAGTAPVSRCTHCNLCVATMDRGVRCVLDGASGSA